MRMALAQAIHHARHRVVFQKRLVDQPIMKMVLAEMALEVEAAMALVLRLARSYDLAPTDSQEVMRARLLTPVAKYWICKTAPALSCEAMECLGGNGYVEDSLLPRLYREAPVNAIWEGSGNVMCLDVLRAISRDADAARFVLSVLRDETTGLPGAREAAQAIESTLRLRGGEARSRASVEALGLLAATAALRTAASESVEIFARTRLMHRRGALLGTSDMSVNDVRRLLERALPAA
jgi:putative acyl-CoA dehydrogenase